MCYVALLRLNCHVQCLMERSDLGRNMYVRVPITGRLRFFIANHYQCKHEGEIKVIDTTTT